MKTNPSLRQRFLLSRDMNKHFSGYESEWQLDSSGRRKKVMVYVGDLYRFNYTGPELKKMKVKCGLLCALFLVIFLAAVVILSISAVSSAFVSVPELLALFPCLYMMMGLYNLLAAKDPFEEHTPLLSVKRLKNCCRGILVLVSITLIADIVYLCVHHAWKAPEDPLFIAAMAASLLLNGILLHLLNSFSLTVVKKGRRTLQREAEAAEKAADSETQS